jgi:hypothetical protein
VEVGETLRAEQQVADDQEGPALAHEAPLAAASFFGGVTRLVAGREPAVITRHVLD